MITIINYGLGNINAFVNIYKKADIPVKVASSAYDLKKATKIILPGVGAFDHAMGKLDESGMKEKLNELVLDKKVPVLGICVGMQILAESSEEGIRPGLGWIPGIVRKFDESKITQRTRLPHMGWNDVEPIGNQPIFGGMEVNPLFYFLHSYYFDCINQEDTIATANYAGANFTCAIRSGNIYGVQFHPEKSHSAGIQLLNNFATII